MELLSGVFDGYYQAKIIEIILENYNEELTTKDIMKMADTSQGSTYKYIEFLASKGILIKTKKISKIQFYRLNIDNNYTKAFLLFENVLVTSELDKLIKKEEVKERYAELWENLTHHSQKGKSYLEISQQRLNVNKKEWEKPIIKTHNIKKGVVNKWEKLVKK